MLLIMKILSYKPSGENRMSYIEKSQDFHNIMATNFNIIKWVFCLRHQKKTEDSFNLNREKSGV